MDEKVFCMCVELATIKHQQILVYLCLVYDISIYIQHCTAVAPLVGGHSIFSPNSKFICSITGGSRLTLRDSTTLEIIQLFQCIDKIERFDFSPDSNYVCCALYSRNAIQVFSLIDKDFKCRINEGVAGMINSWWSPDSRTIIVESDFGIQLSFWSLVDATSSIISLPKPSSSLAKGILSQVVAYSQVSQLVAVVHRIELQDYIGVYSHIDSTLSELVKFKARSSDISCINWMTADTHIITVDSPLTYKLCVYSPSGELISVFEAYQHALGIRSLALPQLRKDCSTSESAASASCSLLAVGSFDGKVRIISAYSWQLAFVLPMVHPKDMDVSLNPNNVVTTVEVLSSASGGLEFLHGSSDSTLAKAVKQPLLKKTSAVADSQTVFRATSHSVPAADARRDVSYVQRMVKVLPRVTLDARSVKQAALPSVGVSWLSFDGSGAWLAAREESQPRCLWIWDPVKSCLQALLVQLEAITCAQWRPSGGDKEGDLPPILAFCTGTTRIYFWSAHSGATWADPATSPDSAELSAGQSAEASVVANIVSLQWDATGSRLLLRGKEMFNTCEIDVRLLMSVTQEAVTKGAPSGGTRLGDTSAAVAGSPRASAALSGMRALSITDEVDLDDDDNFL